MAGATVEETAFEDVNMWQALPFMTLYGNLECGRAKSGRRDLMGRQRVARPSLERGMEAVSGKKRTLQHEGVTEGRGGNGSKPPSPNMPHTPLGIRRAGCFLLLCISQTPEMHPRPFFGGFWHPRWSFEGVVPHPRGHPRASAPAWCTCGEPCQSPWTEFSFRRPFLLCWAPLRTFFLQ